jgi:hypothetical protein
MAMGRRRRNAKQASMWVATQDLPRSTAHPFYARAVDLETGAIVGVTVQDADEGDPTTCVCCGCAASAWNDPSRISTRPAGCAACTSEDTRAS